MEYAEFETLAVLSDADIRQRWPDISFPLPIEPDHVGGLGLVPVHSDPLPVIGAGEQLEPGELRRDGDRVVRGWYVLPAPTPDWPALIAARRWQAETGGISLNGMHIDTGRDSQALITGATVQAMLDPAYSLRWKAPAGFVDLTAEQIIGVATAARAHVQACFNREAELLEALEAGTFTPEMLDQGWP